MSAEENMELSPIHIISHSHPKLRRLARIDQPVAHENYYHNITGVAADLHNISLDPTGGRLSGQSGNSVQGLPPVYPLPPKQNSYHENIAPYHEKKGLHSPGGYRYHGKMRPDSIAKSHEYEELPGSRYLKSRYAPMGYGYSEHDDQRFSGGSRKTGRHDSGENLMRANGNVPGGSPYRKRQNPLYNTLDDDLAGVAMKGSSLPDRCAMCQCVALVLIGMVTGALLVLMILLLMGQVRPRNAGPEALGVTQEQALGKALLRIAQLEANYSSLVRQLSVLDATVGTPNVSLSEKMDEIIIHLQQQGYQLGDLNQQVNKTKNHQNDLDVKIETNQQENSEKLHQIQAYTNQSLRQLEMSVDSFSNEVQQMNKSLQDDVKSLQAQSLSTQNNLSSMTQQLMKVETDISSRLNVYQAHVNASLIKISKMEGPKGPPGAGNLTQCRHRILQKGSVALASSTETSPVPENQESYNNWVITGLTCATEGGTEARLKDISSQPFKQYSCECYGQLNGASNRHCYIHIWECPRIS